MVLVHNAACDGNKGVGQAGNVQEETVQHAIGNASQAQSVLDGINPKYFNPESRFYGGFYVGADSDTIVTKLDEHGNVIKFQSYRGEGMNFVIYSDFDNILQPRIVTPVR